MKEDEKIHTNELELKSYLRFLRDFSRCTDDYLYVIQMEENKCWFFGEFEKNYNLTSDGKPWYSIEDYHNIVYSRDLMWLQKDFERLNSGLSTDHNMDYRLVDCDGEIVWINCRGRVMRDAETGEMCLLGRVSDIVLKHKVDMLTGMFNRAKMLEDVKQSLHYHTQGYFVLLGIDNLKDINIKHGRMAGDRELKFFAACLEEENSSQKVYRLEGDVFAVYLVSTNKRRVEQFF